MTESGDYISREDLLERIDGIWDCNDMVFRPNDHCCSVPEDCKGCKWAETRDAIRRIVENFPAADVRPVVRAYWKSVPNKRARVCSRCEADEPYKFADDDANVYNYCPNCGAKMGGEEE